MSQIKNLLFDLGGVLIDLSPQSTLEAFDRLGLRHGDTISARDLLGAGGGELVDRYQVGAISTPDFYRAIASHCASDATDEQVEAAWMAMLKGIPQQRIEALVRAKESGLKLYILSNINEAHVRWTRATLNAALQPMGWTTDTLFCRCFFSNEIQLAKPHTACYDYVLSHADFVPAETLYFDDLQQNIEAGQRAGFQSCQVFGDQWIPLVDNLITAH